MYVRTKTQNYLSSNTSPQQRTWRFGKPLTMARTAPILYIPATFHIRAIYIPLILHIRAIYIPLIRIRAIYIPLIRARSGSGGIVAMAAITVTAVRMRMCL